jgi:hypothetical protein
MGLLLGMADRRSITEPASNLIGGYLFKVLEDKELYVLFWAQREHAIRILPKPTLKIGFRQENSVR